MPLDGCSPDVFCGIRLPHEASCRGLVMPGLWARVPRRGAGRMDAAGPATVSPARRSFFAVAIGVGRCSVDLRPLADRPWIGGSTDGTASDLVFGYNGFGRITGRVRGRAAAASGGGRALRPVSGGSAAVRASTSSAGTPGLLRLFNDGHGRPGDVAGPGRRGHRRSPAWSAASGGGLGGPRSARIRVMWTGWAVVVYAAVRVRQRASTTTTTCRCSPRRSRRWSGSASRNSARPPSSVAVVAAVAVVVTAPVQLVFLDRVDAWTWLRVAVPVGAVLVVIVAGALLWRYPKSRGVVLGGLAAVAVALLVAPAAWSLAGVQHAQSGTFPDARPTGSGATAAAVPNGFPGGTGAAPAGGVQAGGAPAGGRAGAGGGFGGAGPHEPEGAEGCAGVRGVPARRRPTRCRRWRCRRGAAAVTRVRCAGRRAAPGSASARSTPIRTSRTVG